MRQPTSYTIDFHNPSFREGINVTVRNGDKWADRLSVGDQLFFEQRRFDVVGVLYAPFDEVPAPIHKLNHDESCRTVAGIRAELTRIYGPFPNDVIGAVTIIFFREHVTYGAGE